MTACSPRLISWQQFSAPNLSPRSPKGTSNQEDMLKKKLQKEEAMLQYDIEEARLYQKDSDQRRKLEQKIEMRKNLINAMKNTIEVQENVVLNSGFIKVKRSISDDYTKYWCVLNYPTIKLYSSERVSILYYCLFTMYSICIYVSVIIGLFSKAIFEYRKSYKHYY